jgi:hypothetical protein
MPDPEELQLRVEYMCDASKELMQEIADLRQTVADLESSLLTAFKYIDYLEAGEAELQELVASMEASLLMACKHNDDLENRLLWSPSLGYPSTSAVDYRCTFPTVDPEKKEK